MYEIRFPHLGIVLKNIQDGFSVFGFEIKFYGIIIATGFILAYLFVTAEAKRTKQDPEFYLDYFLWLIIPSILGARIYYVLFSWKDYFKEGRGIKDTLISMINIRNGGMAIYGGIIAGVIVLILFAKKRKANLLLMADTCVFGLLIGQILGRWGNFFNREAFGEYTDSLLAMAIPADYFGSKNYLVSVVNQGIITEKMIENVKVLGGMEFIQAHPTFLYESLWNLGLFLILFFYRRHKKFDGELIAIYFWVYGLGRVWIEALRTDSLMLPGIPFKVSQLLSVVCVLAASTFIIVKRIKLRQEYENE